MGHITYLKNIAKIAILLSIAMLLASGKIIRHQHQTVEEQNMAYYEALTQEQRDAKIQLANLKKQIDFLHNTLDQVQDLPSMKTIALQEGLADQRDILYTIQTDLTTPIKFKSVQCKNLTAEQAQSIGEAVEKIQKQTENLKMTINGLSNSEGCNLCQQMKRQYNWDIIYLRELKTMLQPCPNLKPSEVQIAMADINKYNLVSNLNTESNWVYGNTTQSEYYMQMFNQNIGQNVSKCPIETPFIAQGQTLCSVCPENKPIYDISVGLCIQCPEHTIYNSKAHKCLVNGIDCGTKQFSLQTNQCQCPSYRPYWAGKQCIACVLPNFFNQKTLICEKCLDGESYDLNLQKCAPKCEATHVYDQEKSSCVCPKITPFDNGISCVACYLPKYWNLDKKTCEYCKDGHYYDTKQIKCNRCPQANPKTQQGKCYPCSDGTVYKASTNQCIDASHVCTSNYFYNDEKKVCECPAETPFDTGSECVPCYLPKYWSHKTKECKTCPEGTVYVIEKKTCEYCPSDKPVIIGYVCSKCLAETIFDLATKKCIESKIQCPASQNYNSEKNVCECQKHLPFFDGQKCVSCYLPHYWNYDKKECQFCPEKTTYDVEKKACFACSKEKPLYRNQTCYACPQNQFYKKASDACFTAQDFCDSNYQFNREKLQCVCPNDYPFDNGNKCQTCNSPKYWNQNTLKCESCQINFFFNAGISKCERCPQKYPIFSGAKCTACPTGTKFELQKNKCVSFNQFCALEFPQRNFVYDQKAQKCQCPKQYPFDDGKSCVSCFLPKYWSHEIKKCLSCPENQHYNIKQLKCQQCPIQTPILSDNGAKCLACPENSVFKIQKKACVSVNALCESNYVYNKEKDICQCPKNLPFNNGKECVACYLPQYWNHDNNQCEWCPENSIYNTKLKKCIPCPENTPINDKQKMKCVACPEKYIFDSKKSKCISFNQYCPSNKVYNNDKKICECPKTAPFFNGSQCVSCYLPKYWNHNTLNCEFCPQNSIYNTSLKKCIACSDETPITDGLKMKCIACPDNQVFDQEHNKCVKHEQYCGGNMVYNTVKKICECPKTAPFYTGSKCVVCYLPQYWNHDTRACEWCNKNQVYNTQKKRCQICPEGTPVTDSTRTKCVAV